MLEISNLQKTYRGGVKALAGIDLTVGIGMFGLLGPNGAGKSSLMRTIAGLQLPDQGRVMFDGLDTQVRPTEFRRRLGYLPQSFGAYPYSTCRSLLRHMAVLKGLPDDRTTRRQVDELLDLTNLTRHASRSVSTYSGGMRQRFGIAQALLGKPALLILDEPTAGLDPEERLRLYNLLSHLSRDRVVLLSTHIVDDVEQLCSEVAIIRGGRIVVHGDTEELVRSLAGCVWQSQDLAEQATCVTLLSTAYLRGRPIHRYHCDHRPSARFEPVAATLQDRYFLDLRRQEDAAC